MKVIHYMKDIDCSVPAAQSYGSAAQALYNLVVVDGDDAGMISEDETTNAKVNAIDPGKAQAMTSVVELAAILFVEADAQQLLNSTFSTHVAWPYYVEGVSSTVSSESFLNALIKNGNPKVVISPLRLLQLASDLACSVSSDVITDEHVYEALCAFYCSFDERFQMAFYPLSYPLDLASDSACLFSLASCIAKGCDLTAVKHITPTALWLMMLVQEPTPSLLYDYLHKTRQDTGISEDMIQDSSPVEEIDTMRELCDLYLSSMLPEPHDVMDIEPSEDLCRLVADSMLPTRPATVQDVVYSLFLAQGNQDDASWWLNYCDHVTDSCSCVGTPCASHPSYVTLSPEAQDYFLMAATTGDNARQMIASTAFFLFLDEGLEGGAPDVVHIQRAEDVMIGDEMMLPEAKHGASASVPAISPEDKSIIRISRKLEHFGVPTIFQQLMIANMASRNGSLISTEDIAQAANPATSGSPLMVLAGNVAPDSAHAGVSEEAATILATAGIITRRLAMVIPSDEAGALRTYANSLATAIASIQTADRSKSCSPQADWIYTASCPVFDPRIDVFFTSSTLRSGGADQKQGQATLTITTLTVDPSSQGSYQPQGQAGYEPDKLPYLAKFTTDMVELARQGRIGEGIVGRDETISLIETVLTRRDKSNPLLLAPAGAGKSAIAEAVAKRIADKTTSLPPTTNMRSLDLTSLVADGCTAGVLADRMERIMEESVSSHTILFIDEIHVIVSIGNGEMNLGNIMKPYLARDGLSVIGATTEREYNYTIAKDRALSRRFSTMRLPALDFDETVAILKEKQKMYSKYHGVAYSDRAANTIALLAKEYMSDKESPDRELDILDTSASVATRAESLEVQEQHVVEAVRLLTANRSVKTHADIARELITSEYSAKTLDELFPNVAGQYAAKENIVKRISESKLGLSAQAKPKNIFLFVGESGVGKTYMAHEMAPLLDLNQDSDVLTISLGEYQDRASHTRLIGASPQYVGYQEGGILTNFVKAHPDGIVILDEMDKCDPSVLQMFLGVFDTAMLTAADGSIADCRSITFVCTTNSGHGPTKKNAIGFSTQETADEQEKSAITDALKAELGEPLISRMDEIVIFETLTDSDYVDICKISYRRLAERLMQRHGVDLAAAYTEEDLVHDVQQRISQADTASKDARTIWSSFERDIIPKAIELFR